MVEYELNAWWWRSSGFTLIFLSKHLSLKGICTLMKVLIIKNTQHEGPGILEHLLERNSIQYDIIDHEPGIIFPDPTQYNAVFVFGGPDSANDTTRKMIDELRMVKLAVESGIPYLGICLGMQALVKACGGDVHKNPVREIGTRGPDGNLFTMDICPGKGNDPLFSGLTGPLKIFHLHGETVSLPENMELLATGKFCRHQIIKAGKNAYGIQGHFELTPEMLSEWMSIDPELKCGDSERITRDFLSIYEEYRSDGERLFTNFLLAAGLTEEIISV
jgi:GMP synthase-like glutamine amidotransferase